MRARRGASTVMALFVVVWLNMALQPCLMAAEPLLPDQQQRDCHIVLNRPIIVTRMPTVATLSVASIMTVAKISRRSCRPGAGRP